jgi:hypothetical protein
MKSYAEIIKDDKFDLNDKYRVNTDIKKCCWGCEKGCEDGYMVWDTTKTRRIFFCQDCLDNLK